MLLKDEMLRSDTKANFMTVPAALRELDKIEMVRSLDGNYRIDHAVTATQKAILDAFGIDIPYIKRNTHINEERNKGAFIMGSEASDIETLLSRSEHLAAARKEDLQ